MWEEVKTNARQEVRPVPEVPHPARVEPPKRTLQPSLSPDLLEQRPRRRRVRARERLLADLDELGRAVDEPVACAEWEGGRQVVNLESDASCSALCWEEQ